MKWSLLLVLGISCLTYAVKADEDSIEIPDDFSLEDDDEALLRELELKHVSADIERENNLAEQISKDIAAQHIGKPRIEIDPCTKIRCGAGRVCSANGEKAACVCIPSCSQETNPRRLVCTNRNETWNSDCEVHRQRCLCDTNDPECKGKEYGHIHIDYYGACREIPECIEEEMADFPRRMRDWLYNVMRDLAERDELSEFYKQMELEAETNLTRRWTNAAVWKFCDLDGNPPDRSVSRHELFPIRAPLVSLEHCIAPFLESCDSNNDHRINLKEWGKCLELDEDEMLEHCETLNSDSNKIEE